MAAEGDAHQRAALILGSAEHVRKASGIDVSDAQRPQHERSMALALEGLGQRRYDEAYESGLATTVDEGVAFAIEDRMPSPSKSDAKIGAGFALPSGRWRSRG